MRSLLALALLVLAVAALLSKQMLAFLVLAPLAWWAMVKAQRARDDLGALMGVCVVVATAIAVIEYGGALFP